MKSVSINCLFVVLSAAALVGCSSAPKVAETKTTPELTVLMEQAATAEKAGQKDAALRQYEEAARLYPASKLPWSKTAQIQFDNANYGEAIVAAQQVVSRDDKDKVAHSILSVSGLRVSTKALADLSKQNELTGSVRNEAQNLAKVLRESLGEKILVPPQPVATTVTESAPTRAAPPPVTRSPVRTAAPTRTTKAAEPATSGGGGSPFGALK
jgi:hypothetical protein